ncbi:response regulator transcription factor [Novosphingobium album (ex Liu et al. 2023)]|uniref:Helix-turn-helix transcriptional regulator n=1 Tax=Novosphingobium album (ex Liu et al. 2023) TaxID=3031130 RepID=A0ABT5WR90_9SPHN|nr:helix-turn-helix transcriptional regulator [Novosphingobium album (ex Liu et al. 2023)]MDE8652256.1 helix-turn-helix transcriptional regulator [Novosphingobium album (ex Liu et al. 2023)]
MSIDAAKRLERLSPRQQQCLRLVYERRTSKEIALELGLGTGTVDAYLKEAIAVLGARNRRHAAELLHAHDEKTCSPGKLGAETLGVGTSGDGEAERFQDGRSSNWTSLLPYRPHGANGNDLKPLYRVFWIGQIGIACATGFGMLVVGLEVLSRLIGK